MNKGHVGYDFIAGIVYRVVVKYFITTRGVPDPDICIQYDNLVKYRYPVEFISALSDIRQYLRVAYEKT